MKNLIQTIFAGALGALAAYFNVLLIPLVVLVAVMLLDYVTGMASAKRAGELSSSAGIIGILKKAGYLALVIVGIVLDYLITAALVKIGVNFNVNYFFGLMVTIWLIINELLSILENLGELGVPLPGFLVKSIKSLKNTVDEKADGQHFIEDIDEKGGKRFEEGNKE